MSRLRNSDTLIFDGDCGFCTRSVHWLIGRGGQFEYLPWQNFEDLDSLGITLDMVHNSAVFVTRSGDLALGSNAIGEAMKRCGGSISILGRFINLSYVSFFAQSFYRIIAKNRGRLPGSDGTCGI